MRDYYPDGARRPRPGFFAEDRVDTSWLGETPPGGQPSKQRARQEADLVDVTAHQRRRRVNWAGMPGRVSTARWSLGRTIAGTIPVTLVLAVLCLLGVRWLFGVWSWWSLVPAALIGLGWLTIAAVDAIRYALRGGPPPPIL